MAFVPRRQDFCDTHLSCLPTESDNTVDGALYPLLVRCRRGDNMRDGSAMPGDHDGLAPLHGVEELRQPGFHLGGLGFTHG